MYQPQCFFVKWQCFVIKSQVFMGEFPEGKIRSIPMLHGQIPNGFAHFWFFGISWCMVWVVTPLFGDLRLILVSKLCISKLQKDNLCLGFDRYYCTLWFNLAMEHGPCNSLCEKMVMFQFANGSMISTWINPQQKSHRIPGLVNVYITMENHHV